MLHDNLKTTLVERLKQADPHKIILFGSYARGELGPDSDVDLLVVTDDNFLPASFAEKNAIYHKIADALGDLPKHMPIDLIVHTKAMHRKFIELDSLFSRKIAAEGTVLYEKSH